MVKLLEFFRKNFKLDVTEYSCEQRAYSNLYRSEAETGFEIRSNSSIGYDFIAEGYITDHTYIMIPPSYGSIRLENWSVYSGIPPRGRLRFTIGDGPEDRELKSILGII